MIITLKDLSQLSNDCPLCRELLSKMCVNLQGKKEIDGLYLRRNPTLRKHLKNLIGK